MRGLVLSLLLLSGIGGGRTVFAQEEDSFSAHDFLQRGMRRRMRGEYPDAIYDLTEALRLDDSIPGLYMARGMAYLDRAMKEGRWETLMRAEEDFDRAIYADVNNGRAYALRGFVRALRGNQRGLPDIRQAQQIDSSLPPEGFAALGLYAMDAGAWDQAKLFLEKGISLVAPGFPIRAYMIKKAKDLKELSKQNIRTSTSRRSDGRIVEEGESIQALLLQLQDGTPEQREDAAKQLAIPGNERALQALIDALRDPVLRVRAQAADSLGKIGMPRASKALLAYLDAQDRRFRGVVIRALGEIGSERAKKPLEKRLSSETEKALREEIRVALKKIDEAAFTMKMDLEYMLEEFQVTPQ